MPWYGSVSASLVVGVISAVIVYKVLVPWHKKKIQASHQSAATNGIGGGGGVGGVQDVEAANPCADNKETTALSVIAQRPDASR